MTSFRVSPTRNVTSLSFFFPLREGGGKAGPGFELGEADGRFSAFICEGICALSPPRSSPAEKLMLFVVACR